MGKQEEEELDRFSDTWVSAVFFHLLMYHLISSMINV